MIVHFEMVALPKNFNRFGFVSRYYNLMTKFKIHVYIELGYGCKHQKQNPFYNFNFEHLNKIVGKSVNRM